MLEAIGVAYAIKDHDGNMHGALQTTVHKRRPLAYPMGTISNHVRKHIANLAIGAIAHVPCEDYGRSSVSSTTTAMLIAKYGKGTFKTAYNKQENVLEVILFG